MDCAHLKIYQNLGLACLTKLGLSKLNEGLKENHENRAALIITIEVYINHSDLQEISSHGYLAMTGQAMSSIN